MTQDHAVTPRDWERPGAHPVAPGIFRIPLPMPHDGLKAVNVYAVVSGPGVVLIDGGWAIAEAEQRLAASLDPVNQALATLETAAHLDVLAERGHIRRQECSDGLIRYAR